MTTEAAAATAPAPSTLGREQIDELAKTRYGTCTLPSGSRIVFSSLRRSVMYSIDSQFFGDDGKAIEDRIRERPARILAAVLCDAHGKRLYADAEWERLDALPSEIFEPLWTAVRKHLGLEAKVDDEEAADAPND